LEQLKRRSVAATHHRYCPVAVALVVVFASSLTD